MRNVLSAGSTGRAARPLTIAPARYPNKFDSRPASGNADLALLATMPLTRVAGDVCRPRRATDPGGVSVPPFASEQFHAITKANPECVWAALTATGFPLNYLNGMRVDTDWQPGARVTMALTDQWRLTGEVLAAEPPHRLSYTLDDPPGSPSVYVTWELRRADDGTIIHLNVDEPWPPAGSTDDLESAWLPVLSGLVKHLERGPASPSENRM